MRFRSDEGFIHKQASDITPLSIYEQRRVFLQQLLAAGWVGAAGSVNAQAGQRPGKLAPLNSTSSTLAGVQATDTVTPYKNASTYNNFYEFGTDKADPAENAHTLKTRPWSVEIEGLH
jgi:sulfoxide reductase catalytic subunit YedY